MVVIMGWKKGAQYSYFSVASDYPQAAANTQAVGSQLSDTLNYLKYLLPGTKLYAIGHSLGAHLMGYAGKFDHELLTRITGRQGLRQQGLCAFRIECEKLRTSGLPLHLPNPKYN